MADKKISQLTAATTPLAGTEVLPIVQGTSTVKVANNDLRPKQIQSIATSGVLRVLGPSDSSARVMITPDEDFTVARTDAAQTFSAKQTVNASVNGDVITNLVNTSATGYGLRTSGGASGGGYAASINAYDNTELFQVAGNGDTALRTGNLVIGTSGKGIDFSATAGTGTSELLADYEEGTWTPAITGLSSGTINYKAQNGTYTKIGRLVTVQFWIRLDTPSSPVSSGLLLSGLPYTSDSASTRASIAFRGYNLTGVTGIVGLWMNDSSTTANLVVLNNGSATGLLGSNLQLDAEIDATFSYVAA